jgi:tripartite-type tricarboxylate transporter receptor subunit TctC
MIRGGRKRAMQTFNEGDKAMKNHFSRRRALAAASLAGLGALGLLDAAHAADASDFPSRPITIVVGYSPGGANDVLARIYADKLGAELGQPVIVENRPGVAAIIGTQYVANAKPDGYTLLMGASGPMVFNHALYRKLPYKQGDLAPISLVGTFPLVALTQAANPAKNIAELVEASKKNPDKSNYGASAASFQLITELFNEKTGARFSHVPYKGSNDSILAVMSGNVTMTLVDTGPATTAVQGGRVKALAVTSSERLKALPQVPTMKELGIDLTVTLWSGLLAPAATPQPIIDRLNQAIVRVGEMPEVKARITALSIDPVTSSPEAFAQRIASEIKFWGQVAREKNIYAD